MRHGHDVDGSCRLEDLRVLNVRRAGIVSLKAGSKASPNIKAHISGIDTQFELVTQPVTQPT
jgi:hypothetical protein